MNMLKKKQRCAGQALIEFSLLFPLLFLLIANVVNFGGFFYAWITVANAARAGAQYMVVSDTWISGVTPPSASQVSALIATDLVSLPNRTSAVVKVCINISGAIAC